MKRAGKNRRCKYRWINTRVATFKITDVIEIIQREDRARASDNRRYNYFTIAENRSRFT